jgi:RimJ/RimL family protein N-acetyltransferase
MVSTTLARLDHATIDRLDAYARDALGCPPELAHAGGITLRSDRARAHPVWHGYVLPIVGLMFAEGAVISVRPDLHDQLRGQMGSDVRLARLDAAAERRLLRALQRTLASAFTLGGDLRAVDVNHFQRSPHDRAELIPRPDPAAMHLRPRFDGEVFGVRGPRERVVSWAALKLKTPDVWEIAVATEPDYRGRGYARDVVSAATRYTLEQGRVPIYVHDRDNTTSAFVSRALGYQLYAGIVFGEY